MCMGSTYQDKCLYQLHGYTGITGLAAKKKKNDINTRV